MIGHLERDITFGIHLRYFDCPCSFPYELLYSLMGLAPHVTYELPVQCLQAIEMVKSAVTQYFHA